MNTLEDTGIIPPEDDLPDFDFNALEDEPPAPPPDTPAPEPGPPDEVARARADAADLRSQLALQQAENARLLASQSHAAPPAPAAPMQAQPTQAEMDAQRTAIREKVNAAILSGDPGGAILDLLAQSQVATVNLMRQEMARGQSPMMGAAVDTTIATWKAAHANDKNFKAVAATFDDLVSKIDKGQAAAQIQHLPSMLDATFKLAIGEHYLNGGTAPKPATTRERPPNYLPPSGGGGGRLPQPQAAGYGPGDWDESDRLAARQMKARGMSDKDIVKSLSEVKALEAEERG